jgi:hypothetical protein
VLIAALLMASGLSVLFGGTRPGSVNAALPTPLLLLWAGVITVGGAMVVAAAITGPVLALYLELAADPPLAVMCVVYGASAATLAGLRAVVPVALVAAAAAAFAIRAAQVIRTLVKVRRSARSEESES